MLMPERAFIHFFYIRPRPARPCNIPFRSGTLYLDQAAIYALSDVACIAFITERVETELAGKEVWRVVNAVTVDGEQPFLRLPAQPRSQCSWLP